MSQLVVPVVDITVLFANADKRCSAGIYGAHGASLVQRAVGRVEQVDVSCLICREPGLLNITVFTGYGIACVDVCRVSASVSGGRASPIRQRLYLFQEAGRALQFTLSACQASETRNSRKQSGRRSRAITDGRNLDSDYRVGSSTIDCDTWRSCLDGREKQITRFLSTGTRHALSDDIGESK